MRGVFIAAGLVLVAASGAGAQTKPLERAQPWADGCEGEVIKRVRKEVGSTTRVEFAADTELQWKKSDTETGVRGDGRYEMPGGNFQPISFECVYDTRTSKITSARYTLR
jgi:hypothetical protein